MLPVIDAAVQFKSPIFYDESIVIKVQVFEEPSIRLKTYYQVYAKEREMLCVQGMVTLVFMSEENRRPCRAPQYFMEKFKSAISDYK